MITNYTGREGETERFSEVGVTKSNSEQCFTVTFSNTRYAEIMKITNSADQHRCRGWKWQSLWLHANKTTLHLGLTGTGNILRGVVL